MRRLAIFMALTLSPLALFACQEAFPLREYESTVRALREPISVTHVDRFLDGTSWGFTIEDAAGTELSFCVQGVAAENTTRDVTLMFGIGFLHVGARDWQRGRTIPVTRGSELEQELLDLMRSWTAKRFPTWTSRGELPLLLPRSPGAVDDSLAAQGFVSTVKLVERREFVLKTAVYPGW
jgi:hypothetical protein